jgi:TRAP-type C4-dicarboxylate transport system permease small subunit
MAGAIATGRVAAAIDAAARLCLVAAILSLALLSGLIVLQVGARNFFDMGMPWADELARYCGVALVYLCVPILAMRGQHVAVDMVPALLPPRVRRVALIGGELCTLAFAALVLWGLQSFLVRAGKFTTPALGIPNWVFYAPAAIGILLLLLVTIGRIAILVHGGTPARPQDGPP